MPVLLPAPQCFILPNPYCFLKTDFALSAWQCCLYLDDSAQPFWTEGPKIPLMGTQEEVLIKKKIMEKRREVSQLDTLVYDLYFKHFEEVI